MRLLCFDPLRCTDIPGITYIKPELLFRHRDQVLAADWLLFPPLWLANTLVYALHRRIFPSLSTFHLGYDKAQMTRAFEALAPAHLPDTLITRPDASGVEQALERFCLPVVVKELRSSMGRGVHLVRSAAELRALAARMDALYVQEYLPIDRDLRVVWVGDRVIAAYWRVAGEGAFHNNLARGARASFERIPEPALELVSRVARALGIDHAGFDVAMVDGHPYLLELNRLFGNEALNAHGIRVGPRILEHLRRGMLADPQAPRPAA
jgi:ribosomal protein S6--L-glutamate ligase